MLRLGFPFEASEMVIATREPRTCDTV
jgi:hypothetical protein